MQENIQFRHFFERSGRSKSGATIAYVVNEEKKTMDIGIAFCSEKDCFSRKVGRRIALAKFNNKPLTIDTINIGNKILVEETLQNLVDRIYTGDKHFNANFLTFPTWLSALPVRVPESWFEWR